MVAMHSDFKIFGMFKMSALKWRALVFVFGSVAAMTTDIYACPKYCVCNGIVMKCEGVIPEDIPEPIKEVELVDLDQDVLLYEVFCHSNLGKSLNSIPTQMS